VTNAKNAVYYTDERLNCTLLSGANFCLPMYSSLDKKMEVTGGHVGTVWKVYLILVDPTVTSVTHVLCGRMLSYQVIPLQQHFVDPEQLLTPSHVLMGLLNHMSPYTGHICPWLFC